MTCEVDRNPSETSLCMRSSKDPRSSKCRLTGCLVVVWDVEGLRWLGLEALRTVPCHVLDHHESPIRNENHVKGLYLSVQIQNNGLG
jgi:hypothetical protein